MFRKSFSSPGQQADQDGGEKNQKCGGSIHVSRYIYGHAWKLACMTIKGLKASLNNYI